MTHPITGHSRRCLCPRCDALPDVAALQRALDEKTERVEKLEKALEWASENEYVVLSSDCWMFHGYREYFSGEFSEHRSSADALIALHERAGK